MLIFQGFWGFIIAVGCSGSFGGDFDAGLLGGICVATAVGLVSIFVTANLHGNNVLDT